MSIKQFFTFTILAQVLLLSSCYLHHSESYGYYDTDEDFDLCMSSCLEDEDFCHHHCEITTNHTHNNSHYTAYYENNPTYYRDNCVTGMCGRAHMHNTYVGNRIPRDRYVHTHTHSQNTNHIKNNQSVDINVYNDQHTRDIHRQENNSGSGLFYNNERSRNTRLNTNNHIPVSGIGSGKTRPQPAPQQHTSGIGSGKMRPTFTPPQRSVPIRKRPVHITKPHYAPSPGSGMSSGRMRSPTSPAPQFSAPPIRKPQSIVHVAKPLDTTDGMGSGRVRPQQPTPAPEFSAPTRMRPTNPQSTPSTGMSSGRMRPPSSPQS